jgi:hypothetical protein
MRPVFSLIQGTVFVGMLLAPSAWAQFSGHEMLLGYQESGKESKGLESKQFVRPKSVDRMLVDRLLTLPADRLDQVDREFLQAVRQKPVWIDWEHRAVVEIAKEHPELSPESGSLSSGR